MAKKTSAAGIALIKSFEGCRLTAYKAVPTETYWTIGWGHYGPDVIPGMTISQNKADKMFVNDLAKYEAYVNDPDYVPQTINQNQFDALVSFCYNCGPANLKKLCSGRTLDQIADNITKYNKSGGKVLAGLTRRREKELALFRSGGEVVDNKSSSRKLLDKSTAEEIIKNVLQPAWASYHNAGKVLQKNAIHELADELRERFGIKTV